MADSSKKGGKKKATAKKKATSQKAAAEKVTKKKVVARKKAAKKVTSKKKVSKKAAKSAAKWRISHEQRWQMIAEAAYHKAAARGFSLGGEIEDWLNAEAEIEAMLAKDGVDYID